MMMSMLLGTYLLQQCNENDRSFHTSELYYNKLTPLECGDFAYNLFESRTLV